MKRHEELTEEIDLILQDLRELEEALKNDPSNKEIKARIEDIKMILA